MQREIGSEFEWPAGATTVGRPAPLEGMLPFGVRQVFLASGRDALHYIVKLFGLSHKDEILLPSYLCAEVLEPFLIHGVRVRFYSVNRNLGIDIRDLETKITKDSRALLYIHYFGFPQAVDELERLRSRHPVYVIEDCAQSFLSQRNGRLLGDEGDVSLSSYRKMLPVPDGALLSINLESDELHAVEYKRSVENWLYVLCRCVGLVAKKLKVQHPFLLPKIAFRQLFFLAERLLAAYPKPARMSSLSRHLLSELPIEKIIDARRKNFRYLLEHLGNTGIVQPLHQILPEGVCPLGFPVLTDNRELLLKTLIRHKIYPPVHWPLPKQIDRGEFAESWFVSDHILTIPIDQRYGEDDVDRILSILNGFGG